MPSSLGPKCFTPVYQWDDLNAAFLWSWTLVGIVQGSLVAREGMELEGICPPCHHSTSSILSRWIMGPLRPSGYLRSTNRWKSSKGFAKYDNPPSTPNSEAFISLTFSLSLSLRFGYAVFFFSFSSLLPSFLFFFHPFIHP